MKDNFDSIELIAFQNELGVCQLQLVKSLVTLISQELDEEISLENQIVRILQAKSIGAPLLIHYIREIHMSVSSNLVCIS